MSLPKVNVHRHVVIAVACVVVAVAAVAFVAYKHHQAVVADNARQAAVVQAGEKAAAAHNKAVAAVQARVDAECTKETKYYSLLTVAQKKTVVAPDCAAVQVVR